MLLVQVGNLEDSNVYIRMKSKAAIEVQIAVKHIKLPREVCQITLLCDTMFSQLYYTLWDLERHPTIHAIAIQHQYLLLQ